MRQSSQFVVVTVWGFLLLFSVAIRSDNVSMCWKVRGLLLEWVIRASDAWIVFSPPSLVDYLQQEPRISHWTSASCNNRMQVDVQSHLNPLLLGDNEWEYAVGSKIPRPSRKGQGLQRSGQEGQEGEEPTLNWICAKSPVLLCRMLYVEDTERSSHSLSFKNAFLSCLMSSLFLRKPRSTSSTGKNRNNWLPRRERDANINPLFHSQFKPFPFLLPQHVKSN